MRLRYRDDIFSVNTVNKDGTGRVCFKVIYRMDFEHSMIKLYTIEGLTHSSAEHMMHQMLTTGYINLNEWRDITVNVR